MHAETIRTAYGSVTVSDGIALVQGEASELGAWAYRPGSAWPCSMLRRCGRVEVAFAPNGDLIDLEQFAPDGVTLTDPDDDALTGAELSAWTSDVLRAAGLAHPAIRD